jgi:hypothetical protein
MAKITNKQNLLRMLDEVRSLLDNEESSEKKMIIESMFCLEQMISSELSNRLCREEVFKAISN